MSTYKEFNLLMYKLLTYSQPVINLQLGKLASRFDVPERPFKRGQLYFVQIDIDQELGRTKRCIGFKLAQYIDCTRIGSDYKVITLKNVLERRSLKTKEFRLEESFTFPEDTLSTIDYAQAVITVRYVFKIYIEKEKFEFPMEAL